MHVYFSDVSLSRDNLHKINKTNENEPQHDKTNKIPSAPSEDSGQTGRIQRRLRSAWVSAQSDQSLRCPHEEIYP